MKYWVFDGNDVVGPFALQEIAARADFSASTLICAEDASEDAAGWQMASFFDVFRFNPVTGKLEVIVLPDGSSLRAAAAAEQPGISTEKKPDYLAAAKAAAQEAAILPDVLKPGVGPEKAPAPEMQAQQTPSWVPPAQVVQSTGKKNVSDKGAANNVAAKTEVPPVVKNPTPAPIRVSSEKIQTQPPVPVALAHDKVDLVLPEKPTKVAKQEIATEQPAAEKTAVAAPSTQTEKPQEEPTENPGAEVPATKSVVAAPQAAQTDAPAVAQEVKPAPKTEPKKETPVVVQKKPEEEKKTTVSSLATPETEILSTCTLPIINEVLTQSDLPSLPEGEFQPVALPAEPEFDFKEFLAGEVSAQPGPDAPATGDAPVVLQTVREITPTDAPAVADKSQAASDSEPEERLISQTEKIYPTPQRPQEEIIEEIERKSVPHSQSQEESLLEQQLLEQPTRRSAHLVLWILLLLVLAGAGWASWNKYFKPKPVVAEPPAPVQTQAVAKPQPVEPAATPAPVTPKPMTAEEKALAAVQNFQLPGDKGTIASYFDRVYQDRIAQGYTAHWSVEPLHKSTYIVKYRLTKTRTEPVVYVFQADAVRGQLTGALNNIALDLVGRI